MLLPLQNTAPPLLILPARRVPPFWDVVTFFPLPGPAPIASPPEGSNTYPPLGFYTAWPPLKLVASLVLRSTCFSLLPTVFGVVTHLRETRKASPPGRGRLIFSTISFPAPPFFRDRVCRPFLFPGGHGHFFIRVFHLLHLNFHSVTVGGWPFFERSRCLYFRWRSASAFPPMNSACPR